MDRRRSETTLTPDQVADKILERMRPGDDKSAVVLAMANKVGLNLNATVAPDPDLNKDADKKPEEVLSPESLWLGEFKTRFDSRPDLHPDIEWADVEKSLKADPESIGKLQVLDEAGFEMNVFRAKNDGEIQFRTAQTDVTKIAAKYRTIMYDEKAQTDYPQYHANGNAVSIAASMGVELADGELYEQLRVQKGWVWLKTDASSRKAGVAFCGVSFGFHRYFANYPYDLGSFCAALRVKKA